MRRGLLVLLALALLSACGSGGGPGDAGDAGDAGVSDPAPSPVTWEQLSDRSFASTAVEGHELVEGSVVALSFERRRLSVNAGCNTMSGDADLTDGVLVWTSEPITTLMGCPEDLAAQDQWLTSLLTDGVDASYDEDEALVLSRDGVALTLAEASQDATLEDLLGTRWTLVGITEGEATRSVAAGVEAAYVEVARDGSVSLFTGCNRGNSSVTVEGESLVFAPAAITRKACAGEAGQMERAVLAVLEGRIDDVAFDGTLLQLRRGDAGLTLQVTR